MHMREVTASPALPRYWLERLSCSAAILATLLISWQEPDSLLHRVIDRSGPEGWWCVCALCALCGLGILDVVVNDFLPPRFTLQRAKDWRHLIFLAMGMGLVSVTYVMAEAEGWRPLLLLFPIHAVIAVAVAFFDMFQRHRSPA